MNEKDHLFKHVQQRNLKKFMSMPSNIQMIKIISVTVTYHSLNFKKCCMTDVVYDTQDCKEERLPLYLK